MSGIDNSYKMDGDVLLVISLFLSPLSLSPLSPRQRLREREKERSLQFCRQPRRHINYPPLLRERPKERGEREEREGDGGREVVCSCTLPEWRSRPKRTNEKKCQRTEKTKVVPQIVRKFGFNVRQFLDILNW